MVLEPQLRVNAQQQSDDAAGESQDAGFGREIAMRRFVLGGGVHHQEPRDRRQKELREDLLLDAVYGLGVQLAQGESIA
ncbi:MAG: hypothetical protein INH34_17480, partial [Phycisphaerales bacterium]|nr:hypothetical protein [Phycisphaerales bacterium]